MKNKLFFLMIGATLLTTSSAFCMNEALLNEEPSRSSTKKYVSQIEVLTPDDPLSLPSVPKEDLCDFILRITFKSAIPYDYWAPFSLSFVEEGKEPIRLTNLFFNTEKVSLDAIGAPILEEGKNLATYRIKFRNRDNFNLVVAPTVKRPKVQAPWTDRIETLQRIKKLANTKHSVFHLSIFTLRSFCGEPYEYYGSFNIQDAREQVEGLLNQANQDLKECAYKVRSYEGSINYQKKLEKEIEDLRDLRDKDYAPDEWRAYESNEIKEYLNIGQLTEEVFQELKKKRYAYNNSLLEEKERSLNKLLAHGQSMERDQSCLQKEKEKMKNYESLLRRYQGEQEELEHMRNGEFGLNETQ